MTVHCFINNILNISSYIHLHKLVVTLIGIYAVGEKYINQLVVGINPGKSAGEAGMTVT